jgi:hypothetical protein
MGERSDEYRLIRKNLIRLRDEVATNEARLNKILPKVISENISEALENEALLQIEQPKGLNRVILRDFLCHEKTAVDIGFDSVPIAVLGSGPWHQQELQTFLTEKGFECVPLSEGETVLVLGEIECEEEDIHEFISNAISGRSSPKIYSQEMLIYHLISGEDPFVAWERDALFDAVQGHQGMQFVFSYEELSWPDEIEFSEDDDFTVAEIDTGDWKTESPLKKLGYTARDGALSDRERREILTAAFEESIEHLLSTEQERRLWGRERSTQRLYAISKFINWLSEFQGNQKPLAYEKWRSDLKWLKTRFYTNRMQFQWPTSTKHSPQVEKREEFEWPKNTRHSPQVGKRENFVAKITNKLTPLFFSQLYVGQRVYHERFGWGEVARLYSVDKSPRVDVAFVLPHGTRTIDMSTPRLFN